MRLLSVHAHPDDESSKGAATCARYVSQGHQVRIVTATGGERGDVLNPALMGQALDLPTVRRQEMARAAQALGVEHRWLGFVDSGYPDGRDAPLPEGCFALAPFEETVPALVRQIREFRPHVLVTYNEEGGYPHPDHLMTHEVSRRAWHAAADASFLPDSGPAWQIAKVYYDVSFSRARLEALHGALLARNLASPLAGWLEARRERAERQVSARIEVAAFFAARDEALRAHATQIDPEGWFFAVPRDIEREVWPWEEFELAFSVRPVAGIESCLFEGIVEDG